MYATDLFDKATARVLGEQFVRVLDGVTADPAIAVGDVAVPTPPASVKFCRLGRAPLDVRFATVSDMVAAQVQTRRRDRVGVR